MKYTLLLFRWIWSIKALSISKGFRIFSRNKGKTVIKRSPNAELPSLLYWMAMPVKAVWIIDFFSSVHLILVAEQFGNICMKIQNVLVLSESSIASHWCTTVSFLSANYQDMSPGITPETPQQPLLHTQPHAIHFPKLTSQNLWH